MSISSATVHSKIFWLAKGSTAKGSPTVTATGMPPLKTTRPALRTEKDTGSGGDTASTDSMGAGPLSAHDVGERACGGPESIGTALAGTGAQCTALHCTGRAEGGWGRARDTTQTNQPLRNANGAVSSLFLSLNSSLTATVLIEVTDCRCKFHFHCHCHNA